LKDLISLKEIKYKEIDEFVEIFNSWNSKVPYEVEKFQLTFTYNYPIKQ